MRNVVGILCARSDVPNFASTLSVDVLHAGVKMEALFQIILGVAGTKLRALLRIFQETTPNLYHHFFARLLQTQSVKRIVTTNFDTHIERAAGTALNVFVHEEEFNQRILSGLYKIHGTVERPDTMVAVLKQVARGLGPHARTLMAETLKDLCVVIGWSDDDIDLTPAFLKPKPEPIVWFFYDPGDMRILDFRRLMARPDLTGLPPKIVRIVQECQGVLIACDPAELISQVWQDLAATLGPIPIPGPDTASNLESVCTAWTLSLTQFERLLVIGDILRHISRWRDASTVFRQAEKLCTSPHQRLRVHERLGQCARHLTEWSDSFHYFHLCLAEHGYPGTIEFLLEQRPEDPVLAPLYGNFGALLEKIGRVRDSLVCLEMDAVLGERFNLDGNSEAAINYAQALAVSGSSEAAHWIKRATTLSQAQGDFVGIGLAHSVAARIASRAGEWRRAEAELDAALGVFDLLGRPDFKVDALKQLAEHSYTIGGLDNARHYIAQALHLAELHGLNLLQAEVWMVLGVTLKETAIAKHAFDVLPQAPELRESLEAYAKSISLLDKSGGEPALKSVVLNNRGLLYLLIGKLDLAFNDLWESLNLKVRVGDDVGKATALNNLALVFINGSKVDEAEDFLQEALTIYDRFGHKAGRCQVLHDLAGVHMGRLQLYLHGNYALTNQPVWEHDMAKRYLCQSLDLAKDLGIPAKVKQAEHNLAILQALGKFAKVVE
jgi:tetratricopeptide (TPR) repeat protein